MKNKNFINVITDLMKKLVEEKNKGNKVDASIVVSKLIETLNETTEMETNTGNIKFIKNGNDWKLQVNDEFRDLVYPGASDINKVIIENTKMK